MGEVTECSGAHALRDTLKPIAILHNIEAVVSEILSRLPVKPLMRFKCVCKGWLNLIEEDSYFIHLHLARSKARQSLLYMSEIGDDGQECVTLDEFLLTTDLSLEGIRKSTIRTTNLFCLDEILGPINGLICFVDEHKYAVCIYNVSTREASPWVISSQLLDEKEKHPGTIHDYTIRFGFDPTTKEHKVLSMCSIDVGKAGKSGKEASDDYIEVCEILTLGDSTWRRIDEVPPCYLGDPLPWVYVNGSIYWCTYTGIIAFDVGIEKFRMFCIPDYIQQPFYKYSNLYLFLVELDGRVGMVRRVSANNVLKLCTFEDNTKSNRTTPVGNVGDGIWTEETITLPFSLNSHPILRILSVNGTYKLILLTYGWHISLRSYDRKEKSFTRIRSRRGSSSIPNDCWTNHFSPLVESLIRVRKKRSNNGVITLNLAAPHSPEPDAQKPVDPLIAPSSPVSRHTRSAPQKRQASTQSVAQRTRSKRLNIE